MSPERIHHTRVITIVTPTSAPNQRATPATKLGQSIFHGDRIYSMNSSIPAAWSAFTNHSSSMRSSGARVVIFFFLSVDIFFMCFSCDSLVSIGYNNYETIIWKDTKMANKKHLQIIENSYNQDIKKYRWIPTVIFYFLFFILLSFGPQSIIDICSSDSLISIFFRNRDCPDDALKTRDRVIQTRETLVIKIPGSNSSR